ncbi:DEKNAAC100756 [Brettanomyces naardenensis]|uniref:DNA replication complex GINS protein SLD5 n=1 Tax=Brettanomyces naardenensis TaxID=13370 RepID=A0A448YER6_BRENA|nr:DEKNAAC100756 [Brettanomyces naardenensis]
MNFNDILKDFETEAKGPKLESDKHRADDIQRLTDTWIKEKSVPELLPYAGELLDRLLVGVRKQIEFIEMNSIELQQDEREIKLLLVIVENELDRVQFLIRSYVRVRLSKIDKFAIYLRSEDEELSKLSSNETVYMEKHLELLMDLYNSQFLASMPEGLQALDEVAAGISMVEKPEYERPVFVKCKRDNHVLIDDDEIELTRNGIYVMRYSAIRDLVSNGEVMVL